MALEKDYKIPKERWLPVVGHEGFYEVSDCGRVKRIASGKGATPGRVLAGGIDKDGYVLVSLWVENQQTMCKVHRLVATAFIGHPTQQQPETRHLDGNPANNHLTNLQWGSGAENIEDRTKHGRFIGAIKPLKGVDNPANKLSEADIRKIRQLLANGVTQKGIAIRFNVNQTLVSAIKCKKKWRDVNG